MKVMQVINAARVQLPKLTSCLIAVSLSWSALAQNTGVIESRGIIPGQVNSQSSQSQSRAAGGNNDALTLLLEQNQQLRTELQTLRAMIEEQGFELRRLQRDSLNRYTNMDERLSALEANAVAPVTRNGNGAGTAPDARPNGNNSTTPDGAAARNTGNSPRGLLGNSSNRAAPIAGNGGNNSSASRNARPSGRGTLQPAVLSEQQLYQMAYDSVINSEFERSIAEFDQYLSVYPQGRFVTNAHYWKGQAYLYLNRYNEAREAYEIILDQYPDSAKLPDAMYGLALAYQGLGNMSRARSLLNDIKRRFPNTGVANLADTRLMTLD